ncbi:MAG: nucleotide exchange factor GrpE [Oscillospiraceae bacterium]|nr:nucleotide exchange factor GrpE [Oscillospiraceae bacterium]
MKKSDKNNGAETVEKDNTTVEQEEIQDIGEVDETAEPEIKLSETEILQDRLLRAMAEYDNYRKRTAKERFELEGEITSKVITSFLPSVDNLERALQADCKDENYKKGIELIYSGFTAALEKLGVEEITAEDFDPALHQAVQHVDSDTLESGKVAEVFQKGYKIGNKVIRFAMVAIVK